MKIKHCLAIAASLSMAVSANAATAVVSNVVDGVSETLYATGANTLASTGIATLGYFPSGFVLTTNDIPNLIANFTSITSGVIGGNAEDLGGAFAGYAQSAAVPMGTITTGNALLGRTLYSFFGNGASLAASTLFGLIQTGTIGNDVPFEQAYSSNPGLAAPILGTVGSFTGNAGGQGSATYRTIIMAPAIPEPSAALLGAIGALGLLRRRRI
jgi:hypothetical protein